MNKHCLALLFTLLFAQESLAQVFCLPPDQPKYPEIAIRAGLSVSFLVTLDVVGSSAKNIQISTKDSVDHASDLVQMFSPAIMEYLNRLCFMRDINNFSMNLDFEIRPHESINRGYVEKVAEDRIRIIGRRPHTEINTGGRSPQPFDCYCKDSE